MIESILNGCITDWCGNSKARDCKALQRVVSTAQYITGADFPAIQDLYARQCQRKALKIVKRLQPPNLDCSLRNRTASGIDAPSLEPTGP